MGQRFLRALGYGSILGRPDQVDEDIQMHADRLFQRVLQHEEAVEKAKEAGQPLPVFDPVVPKARAVTIQPTAEIEQKWKEKIEQLPEDERAAEAAALRADYQAKTEVAQTMKGLLDAKQKERESRQAKGQGTFMDGIAALFGNGGRGDESGKQ